MTPLVHLGIERELSCSARVLGDNDLGAARVQVGDDGVAVEGFVSDQRGKIDALEERRHADRIVTMAGEKVEAHEVAERIGQPGSWWSCRLWSGQWTGSESPFCALAVAVDLDDSGVDHGVFHVRLVRAGFKKPDENVGFDPVAVSLEHGVPFAKKGGQIAPRAPRPDHPQPCFNEQPIVLAASTRVRRLAQTMRLHLRPLGVSQNESFHPKLESQTSFPWNPESQQTLERDEVKL